MSSSWSNPLPTIGPYFRLRCACCAYPTLHYLLENSLHRAGWPQACVLCDWDNADPTSQSSPAQDDDGLTLAEARTNARRFAWMYDPNALPDWMVDRPSGEELAARQALAAIYRRIDEDPVGADKSRLWPEARASERALKAIVLRREAVHDPGESAESETDEDFRW